LQGNKNVLNEEEGTTTKEISKPVPNTFTVSKTVETKDFEGDTDQIETVRNQSTKNDEPTISVTNDPDIEVVKVVDGQKEKIVI
jgi:hypothetical protein